MWKVLFYMYSDMEQNNRSLGSPYAWASFTTSLLALLTPTTSSGLQASRFPLIRLAMLEKRPSSPTNSDPKLFSDVQHNERKTEVYNEGVDISGVDERKLMRKIDMALIPWLSFLYVLSFLDRTSIGKCVYLYFISKGEQGL